MPLSTVLPNGDRHPDADVMLSHIHALQARQAVLQTIAINRLQQNVLAQYSCLTVLRTPTILLVISLFVFNLLLYASLCCVNFLNLFRTVSRPSLF